MYGAGTELDNQAELGEVSQRVQSRIERYCV